MGKAAEIVGRPLLAALLVTTLLPGPARAHAAPTEDAADPSRDSANVPAAVLVLDGDDREAAARSTQRLRTALADRGFSSDHTSTTAELALALDCGKFDAACARKASAELAVDKIFYGELRTKPPGLSVVMFDAKAGMISGEVHLPMDGTTVQDQEAAVAEAVRTLLPRDDDELPDPTAAASPVALPSDGGPSTTSPRKYIWGAYAPRPLWKNALLGTSVGLAALGLTLGIAFGIPAFQSQRKRGRLYDELVAASEDSLDDDNPVNDVNPATVDDVCSDQPGSGGALELVTPEGTGAMSGVRNGDVAKICQKGRLYATVGATGWAFFGIGAVGTIVATTLFFVRKNPNATAWRRHGVYVGATPTRRGAALTGGFRF